MPAGGCRKTTTGTAPACWLIAERVSEPDQAYTGRSCRPVGRPFAKTLLVDVGFWPVRPAWPGHGYRFQEAEHRGGGVTGQEAPGPISVPAQAGKAAGIAPNNLTPRSSRVAHTRAAAAPPGCCGMGKRAACPPAIELAYRHHDNVVPKPRDLANGRAARGATIQRFKKWSRIAGVRPKRF